MAARLSLSRMIAIGSGDFGLNLYWQCTSVFLLFFYTEVLGLSPSTGGAIYMAALIWDAAIDPIVGMLADRTRTRWGRFRPYLMFGAVPLAITFVLVFALPMLDVRLRVVLATASHFLFRTLYASVAIPYASLFARVTSDSGERATMAGIRMGFAFGSAILVAGGTLPLARMLGGDVLGWTILATAYSVFACIFLWTAASAAGNDDRDGPHAAGSPPSGAAVRAMAGNPALLIVFAIVLVTSFCGTFFSKNILYFFKYVRHQPEFGGTALGAMAALAAALAPLWAKMARATDKRTTLLVGISCNAVGMALWLIALHANYVVLVAALVLTAAGTSATYVCFWSMLPDTIEYGDWRTGVRIESLLFGVVIFVQKAALGLGAGALGLTLGLIGLTPNASQSIATLKNLVTLMAAVPLAGALIMLGLAWFYPITADMHRDLLEAIAERNAASLVIID